MLKKAITFTLAMAVFATAFHAWLISSESLMGFSFLWMYLLLTVLTLGLYILVSNIHKKSPNKAGLSFLVGSTIKMLVALSFIIPFVLGGGPESKLFVVHFIIPYFVFLIVELFWVFRILRS